MKIVDNVKKQLNKYNKPSLSTDKEYPYVVITTRCLKNNHILLHFQLTPTTLNLTNNFW